MSMNFIETPQSDSDDLFSDSEGSPSVQSKPKSMIQDAKTHSQMDIEAAEENDDLENDHSSNRKNTNEDMDNNHLMDKETVEPYSEVQDAHREGFSYAENIGDDASSVTTRNGHDGQKFSMTPNFSGPRDSASVSEKGRLMKRMTNKQQKASKNTESNKFGTSLKNIYKKNMGKHSTKSSHMNGSTSGTQETTKRKYTKVQAFKTYGELVQIMQNMSKFDWIEAAGVVNKSQLIKLLSAPAFWFMICANFYPRHAFAHKNNKDFIHQRIDALKNMAPDVKIRLGKDHMKDSLPKINFEEFETILANSFSKSIKYSLESSNKNNDNLKKGTTTRAVNTFETSEYTTEDDQWIMDIRTHIYDNYMKLTESGYLQTGDYNIFENLNILSKIEVPDLLNLYEQTYFELTAENETALKQLEKTVLGSLAEEEGTNRIYFDQNDSLADLRVNFPENIAFIDLLEKKKNEYKDVNKKALPEANDNSTKEQGGKQSSKSTAHNYSVKAKPDASLEDSICQVCNGEDYNDDDLIVLCSRCNISVHQKCYGIQTVPNDDWICDLCINFAHEGKYLRCPLCTKRGGVMKPSILRADTSIFETLNPTFHAFLKSYARPELFKNMPKKPYSTQKPKEVKPEEIDLTKINEDESKTNYLDLLYYNFHVISFDFTEEELQNEPKPLFIWAHITCAMFIPGVYFADEPNKTNISAIERIDKQRFRCECLVCRKSNHGAVVNCAKDGCRKAFHPECARRGKFWLESKENEVGQARPTHSIFCKKHTPLKLKRVLESRENKLRDDIDRFYKAIEKYYASYLTESQQQLGLLVDPNVQKDPGIKALSKKKLNIKDDRGYFMKLVERYKLNPPIIPSFIELERLPSDPMFPRYQYLDAYVSRPASRKDRKLTSDDELWTIMQYKGLSPQQKYEKYRKIVARLKKKQEMKEQQKVKPLPPPKQVQYADIYQAPIVDTNYATYTNYSTYATKKSDLRITLIKDENFEFEDIYMKENYEPPEPYYCLCQKPYRGELMLACEKCENWYHPDCVGITQAPHELEMMKWWCEACAYDFGYLGSYYYIDDGTNNVSKATSKRKASYRYEEEPVYPMKKLKE